LVLTDYFFSDWLITDQYRYCATIAHITRAWLAHTGGSFSRDANVLFPVDMGLLVWRTNQKMLYITFKRLFIRGLQRDPKVTSVSFTVKKLATGLPEKTRKNNDYVLQSAVLPN
jgi:hypothetical protein